MRFTTLLATSFWAALFACLVPACADSLLVGFNAQTPLQIYSTSGVFQQDFGPNGASAGVIQDGLLYVVQPDVTTLSSSTITAFDKNQHAVSSFTVPYLIADATSGSSGTLWLSGYNGDVYQVSTSGAVKGSFSTGYSSATSIGITSNGTNLFTTEGDASDGIDERDAAGNIISTFHTGFAGLYGLAFDSSDKTFFAGSFSNVYHFSLSTTSVGLIGTIDIAGDSRTPNGAIHDGLELGDLSSLTGGTPPPPPPPTVPEPGFGLLSGLVLLSFLVYFGRRSVLRWRAVVPVLMLGAGLTAASAFGAVNVTLSHTESSVPVGGTVSFTATATDSTNSGAQFVYQFDVAPAGSSSFSVVKDFYHVNTFDWTPSSHEGSYDVKVVARSSTGASGSTTEAIFVTSRISGSSPVVSSTRNPLVALYSVPPCSSPKQARVRFKSASDPAWQMTPLKPCNGLSVNFYIGGMRANTTYTLQQDLFNGPFDTPGPQLSFKTGSVPGSFPTFTSSVVKAPEAPTSISYPFELKCGGGSGPWATDLQQNIVWFLPAHFGSGYLVRMAPGGTFLGINDGDMTGDQKLFREFDMAGNIIRETNWSIANQELNTIRAAQGKSPARLIYFSHEGYRLPNGYTATLATDEEVRDQGSGPVDVLGDVVLILDRNFQVVWAWDAFDHLDIKRKALGNDVCKIPQGGCPPKFYNTDASGHLYTMANDWTHINSVFYEPKDGSLIASVRHQSWVVKIDYRNGSGTGNIIWRLGAGGNFSLGGGAPASDWFSYEHDAEIGSNGLLTLFDNGNLRILSFGGNARGQAWRLDETNMIATPVVNVDLGVQSFAVGTASLLSNGNYWYQAGFVGSPHTSHTFEVTPSGTSVYKSFADIGLYRVFRLRNLYTP
ncbi:MAG TPA: aryl-sulfate sulfotransferase [Bryobacteraceae bacterium]|nr:aryl-sulfate sulfotransferase [Bryobacteraceae bacterium]